MPVVSLEFEGEESDLIGSTKNVGNAFDKLGDEADNVSKHVADGGKSFDVMEEGADTAERRFTGFYDTLGGTRDAFAALGDESLSTSDKLIALGQAGADLAGGLVDFVIPMVRSLWTRLIETAAAQTILTAAQTAWNTITSVGTTLMEGLNAAMKANPILFIVGLIATLVTAFLFLWNTSEGFRNFFIGMWNGIKGVVGGVIDFIKDVWNGIPGFFRGIVDGIKNVFSGIGDFIKNIFKGAVNTVIDIINGVIWVLNKIVDGLNLIPFVNIPHIPSIKKLQTGGRALKSGLAFIHEGETVRSASESARGGGEGGGTLQVTGDTTTFLYQMIDAGIRTGKLRLA